MSIESTEHSQDGHAGQPAALPSLGQRLAVLEHIDHLSLGSNRLLKAALERTGVRQRQFNDWSRQRSALEEDYRDIVQQGNGGSSKYFRKLSVRHHLTQLLLQYERDFTPEERTQLLHEVERSTGGDPELLTLALEDIGLPQSVYRGWKMEEQEQRDRQARLVATERMSTPRHPASLYAQQHLHTLRRDERTPSTPEQRLRVQHALEHEDGRRMGLMRRALNVNNVTLRAWEKRKRTDLKAVTHDWSLTLARSGDDALVVQPLPERIIADGIDGENMLQHAAVEEALQSIKSQAGQRLRERGVPEQAYNIWMQSPKEIHRSVNAVVPYLKRVECEGKGANGFPIREVRTLTYEECEALLRDIHRESTAKLYEGYMHKDTYANWVQFHARRQQGNGAHRNGNGHHSDADPAAVIAASNPKRRSKYAAANALWGAYANNESPELRNALIEQYLPLVKYQAQAIWSRLPEGVELDDLASAGVFGLMDAIDAFDPARGVKFETYCVPRIRGAILDELRSMDWVPRLVRSHAAKIKSALRELEIEGVTHPDAKAVAAKLDLPVKTVEAQLTEVATMPELISLNKKWYETDSYKDVTETDMVPDDRVSDPALDFESDMFTADVMEYALRGFSRFERELLVLYHVDKFTMKEIGDAAGLSESRVSQLHSAIYPQFEQRLQDRIHRRDPRYATEWDEPAVAGTEGAS